MKRPGTILPAVRLILTLAAAAAILIPVCMANGPWPETARNYLKEFGQRDSGARNMVSAIYLGYRVFDTLGETIVLLVAVSGAIGIIGHTGAVLARGFIQLDDRSGEAASDGRVSASVPSLHHRTTLIEVVTGKLGPVVLVFGLYVMLYGHLSPGGGFQGGVVIASGIVFLALGGRAGVSTRLTEPAVLAGLETASFLLLVLASISGILFGGGFFSNSLEAAGLPPVSFIVLLNAVIGLKVGAGIAFMCIAMLGKVER